jgi:peptidoglycan/LPS O-acetylase OafA/YrhL
VNKKYSAVAELIDSKRETTRLKYVSGLDGLRGVAVLSVIFGHFGVPGFAVAGGYGVEVFFVLSGYLITCVLMKSMADGQSFFSFYWNRLTRLLPALLLVCSALFLVPSSYLTTWGAALNAIGAVTYVTNWTMAIPVFGWPTYMAHTWSLSIEEQFYLIWPVVMWGGYKFGVRTMKWTVISIAALSLLYFVAMTTLGMSMFRLCTGFDTHCSPILIGACLAFFRPLGTDPKIALVAFVVYFFLVFFVPWSPIGVSIVWIATLCIIDAIRSNSKAGMVRSILEVKPLVFIGIISYPAYLWHYPVFRLFQNFFDSKLFVSLFGITLSLLLAYFTRVIVEVPILRFRDSCNETFRARAGMLCMIFSILSIAAGLSFFYGGFIKSSPY